MLELRAFFVGGSMMAAFAIGLYFFKFWKNTEDRLFLFFGAAFFAMTLNEILLMFMKDMSEYQPFVYSVRLIAFILIAVGILDKNRKSS